MQMIIKVRCVARVGSLTLFGDRIHGVLVLQTKEAHFV